MDKKITKAIIGIAILIALYFLNVQQQNSYKNSGSSFLNIEKDLIKKVIISANEDYNIRDIGKVMSELKKNFNGKMDFAKASSLAKALLTK